MRHRHGLWLNAETVETRVRSILGKADLPQDGTHRRVLAVVTTCAPPPLSLLRCVTPSRSLIRAPDHAAFP